MAGREEGGPEQERTGINRKAQHPTNQGYCYYETPLTTHCLDKLHTVKNRDGNRTLYKKPEQQRNHFGE